MTTLSDSVAECEVLGIISGTIQSKTRPSLRPWSPNFPSLYTQHMQDEKHRAYQRVGFDVCFNSLIEEKKGRKENGEGDGEGEGRKMEKQ